MMEQHDNGYARNAEGSWKIRRRIIFTTLIFCASTVIYLMVWGDDTNVNESIIMGSYTLAISVIGSYVFGAVWDDKTRRSHTIGGPDTNVNFLTGAPKGQKREDTRAKTNEEVSAERKKQAKARLEAIKDKKIKVDDPDG